MRRRVIRMLDPILQSRSLQKLVFVIVHAWVSGASRLPPAEALRRLLRLEAELLERIDWLAIELDGGIHAKHRLIRYHDFFVGNVHAGERILDIGCGKGELAHDLATRGGARVTGIDFNPTVLEFARSRFGVDGLTFVQADALTWEPDHDYDVVVLSNVLEHIAPRVELLRRLSEKTGASRVLILVPSRERDWLVPLREELGLAHFSDPTHETEYTVDQLRRELGDSGLEMINLEQRWGELWTVARPAEPSEAGVILGR
jgi:2-polyprenyl-3-methyl-5-hydroxy-6-metoxy-1,4-benzoquinol methylase